MALVGRESRAVLRGQETNNDSAFKDVREEAPISAMIIIDTLGATRSNPLTSTTLFIHVV